MKKRAFTLIELLVVISIVSLLSSVVLASLSGAREKAKNTSARETLQSIKTQAEIRALSSPSSSRYIGFCTDPKTKEMLESMKRISGKDSICVTSQSGDLYTAAIGKAGTASTASYCADSSGFIGETPVPSTSQTIAGSCLSSASELAAFEACFSLTAAGYVTNYNGECTTDLVIPTTIGGQSVVSIGNNAFSNTGLTSVTIPEGVIDIGGSAFYNTPLTSVTIPSSVTSIGPSSFRNTLLTSVVIPDSVTNVQWAAFFNTPLTSVSIKTGTSYTSTSFPQGCTVASGCIIERP